MSVSAIVRQISYVFDDRWSRQTPTEDELTKLSYLSVKSPTKIAQSSCDNQPTIIILNYLSLVIIVYCKACGPGGWCCPHSKMGSCTWKQSNTIKKAGTKGHRCMPPVFTSKPSKLGNKQKPSKKTKLPKHQQPPRLQQRQLQVRLHKSY